MAEEPEIVKSLYTVVGFYEDTREIWVRHEGATCVDDAVRRSIEALVEPTGDGMLPEDIAVVEVFHGHQVGLRESDRWKTAEEIMPVIEEPGPGQCPRPELLGHEHPDPMEDVALARLKDDMRRRVTGKGKNPEKVNEALVPVEYVVGCLESNQWCSLTVSAMVRPIIAHRRNFVWSLVKALEVWYGTDCGQTAWKGAREQFNLMDLMRWQDNKALNYRLNAAGIHDLRIACGPTTKPMENDWYVTSVLHGAWGGPAGTNQRTPK